jgi:hypothetical protein
MRVMNVDAELLERSAAAKRHAQVETEIHIAAEIKGVIPELMDTLSPQGPYAYSILPQITPDGRVKLPVVSTREGVQEAYEYVRGLSYLHSSIPMTEIQGEWYIFHDGISRTEAKFNGEKTVTHLLVLFPSGRGSGITGELAWIQCDPSRLGAPEQAVKLDKDDIFIREDLFNLHEAYLEGLRLNDVETVLGTLNDYVASATRDYVDDNGCLASLEGKDAHRAYYERFFEKFEVRSAHALTRVADTWYAFAEMRLTVRPRSGPDVDRDFAFHRAEMLIPGNDRRVIARIGHGTDVEQVR